MFAGLGRVRRVRGCAAIARPRRPNISRASARREVSRSVRSSSRATRRDEIYSRCLVASSALPAARAGGRAVAMTSRGGARPAPTPPTHDETPADPEALKLATMYLASVTNDPSDRSTERARLAATSSDPGALASSDDSWTTYLGLGPILGVGPAAARVAETPAAAAPRGAARGGARGLRRIPGAHRGAAREVRRRARRRRGARRRRRRRDRREERRRRRRRDRPRAPARPVDILPRGLRPRATRALRRGV